MKSPQDEGRRLRVLIIEDDLDIAEPLQFGLEMEGFEVLHALDGERGLELARTAQPDIVLLDIMLPGVDGFSLLRTLRAESTVPIIMVTARGQELDRVMGLELGADDYVVKPFSFRELLARIKAVLRRQELAGGQGGSLLRVGELSLDRARRQAWLKGVPLRLSAREFRLLEVLMLNAGQALSRQHLLDAVWGPDWVGDPHTLEVHIRWLREKIEEDPAQPRYIVTVRGYGYRLEAP
jgi:DNA-binding response OmpR family regulator